MTIDLFTLEAEAAARLPHGSFEYLASGSGDERTMAANVRAWEELRVRPRVLRDVSAVQTATSALGSAITSP